MASLLCIALFPIPASFSGIEKAAEKLGVNKVTIYSYLDEVRGKRG